MALLAWLKDLTRRVDVDAAPLVSDFAETAAPEAEAGEEWLVSSIDLHDGLEISERPLSTVPGELRDELTKPHRWRSSL